MKKFIVAIMAVMFSIIFNNVVFAQEAAAVKKEAVVKKEAAAPAPAAAVAAAPAAAVKEEVKKEEGKVVIGVIEQIDKDGNFITLKSEDKSLKILCDVDLIEEAYFEIGDKVKLMVQDTKEGMQIVDYEYMYELGEDYSGTTEE